MLGVCATAGVVATVLAAFFLFLKDNTTVLGQFFFVDGILVLLLLFLFLLFIFPPGLRSR